MRESIRRVICAALAVLILVSAAYAFAGTVTVMRTNKAVSAIVSTRYPIKATGSKTVQLAKGTWLKKISKNVGKGTNGKYYRISDMSKVTTWKAKVRKCNSGAVFYSTNRKHKISLAKGTRVLVSGYWKKNVTYYKAAVQLGGRFYTGVISAWDVR